MRAHATKSPTVNTVFVYLAYLLIRDEITSWVCDSSNPFVVLLRQRNSVDFGAFKGPPKLTVTKLSCLCWWHKKLVCRHDARLCHDDTTTNIEVKLVAMAPGQVTPEKQTLPSTPERKTGSLLTPTSSRRKPVQVLDNSSPAASAVSLGSPLSEPHFDRAAPGPSSPIASQNLPSSPQYLKTDLKLLSGFSVDAQTSASVSSAATSLADYPNLSASLKLPAAPSPLPPKAIALPASVATCRKTRYAPASNLDSYSPKPWSSAKVQSGKVSLEHSSTTVPPLPLQTFFLTKDQVDDVPEGELRSMLTKAVECVSLYERAARQFRSVANHYLLQNKLLTIQTHEIAQRHQVETNITQREIEKLITDAVGYSDTSMDVEAVRKRLKRARQRLKDMEMLVDSKDREISDLKQQLRDIHLNSIPKQVAVQSTPVPPYPPVSVATPNRVRPPPIETHGLPVSRNEPLSALELLASQALNENARPPAVASAGTSPKTSPQKRPRRLSSSSTISACSDKDATLEELDE